ncbi:hypothetical protein FXN61_31505 [Lentzea sp. PSKA42]|uniref:Uncharacterized protein n=1 Tax=Lentzea indica TaxID=2604800 RepID=A0ABX1FRC3_9PSEU|nr:hypothetical protein [Lentzea indica]NKE61066.1 hypothetical protein [Lentzea indica]
MTGVRRRGYFAAAVAVLGAALLTGLLAAPDRPVDIRLVAPPPPAPETISASATTAVSAVAPVLQPPPPPPPAPPAAAEPPPRQKPPASASSPKPLPPNLFDFLRCDHKYLGVIDLEHCLEWRVGDTKDFCSFLKEQKLQPIDLRSLGFEKLDCH